LSEKPVGKPAKVMASSMGMPALLEAGDMKEPVK
jgi:hypothetical protein